MFTPRPIGFVGSPYKNSGEVPKGLRAKHEAEGSLKILPEFELGLTDIEGFSHLIVIWEFDRSEGFKLLATPPSDDRPHGVFATRSLMRPNPIGFTVVELLGREGPTLHCGIFRRQGRSHRNNTVPAATDVSGRDNPKAPPCPTGYR